MTGLQHLPLGTIALIWLGLAVLLVGGIWVLWHLERGSKGRDTYEAGKSWIIWHYRRPDWLAMIFGGQVIAECNLCGQEEKLHLGWRGIWSPPKNPAYRHPKRDAFIAKHEHRDKAKHPIFMNRSLLNPLGR